MKIRSVLILVLAAALFAAALSRLDSGRQEQGQQQLEEAVRRSAVSCYALEGCYPPSADYLRQHYGLSYDQNRYSIQYTLFASNLMPDITVLDLVP